MSQTKNNISILGCGNIGSAIAFGLIESESIKLKNLKLKVLKNKLIVYIPEKDKAILTLKKILTQVNNNKDELILADIRKPSLAEVFSTLTENDQKKRKKAKRKA